MDFRKVQLDELSSVMEIINDAKRLLSKDSLQWQQGYPNEKTMQIDIENGDLYAIYEDNYMIGIVALVPGVNVDYILIEGKGWKYKSGRKDATIHRIAVREGYHKRHLGRALVRYCADISRSRGYKSIKADTHIKNIAMQQVLLKEGFEHKGTIYIQRDEEDNGRLAYELVL